MRTRSLEPELLDQLPASDPRAERSRRDLRRINAIMGNARVIARHLGQASRIADLGGGDGSLMRAIERKLGRRLEITNVDRIHGLDVFEFLQHPGKALDAIVANLFLHHLDGASLRRLFALAAVRAPLSSRASRGARRRRSGRAGWWSSSAPTTSRGTTPWSACAPALAARSCPRPGLSSRAGR